MFTRSTEYSDDDEYIEDCMIKMLSQSEIESKAKKAYERRNFSYYFATIPHEERPSELIKISGALSDKEYWIILRGLWANADSGKESTAHRASLLAALNCGRKNRRLMMYEDERNFLNSLSETLLIYRGCARTSVSNGWSWTTVESVAHKFATKYRSDNDGVILRGTCSRKHVIALLHFQGYNESEILINPGDVNIDEERQAYDVFIEQHEGAPRYTTYSERISNLLSA